MLAYDKNEEELKFTAQKKVICNMQRRHAALGSNPSPFVPTTQI